MEDKNFLIWLHQRLVLVHKEDPHVDYMWKLRSIIDAMSSTQSTPNSTLLQPNDPIFNKR